MRKVKLWLLTLLMAVGGVESVKAQTDVTDTYITNAGFDNENDFQTGNIGSDAATNAKQVTGWTAEGSTSWTYGGCIAYGSSGKINNTSIPTANSNGEAIGGALCLSGAWDDGSGYIDYYQNITLPAGKYTLTMPVNNVGKNENFRLSYFGFTTSDNTYAGTVTSFPANTWTNNIINFSLATETSGKLTIGFGWSHAGSGNTPKLIVDGVIVMYSNYTETLQSTIDRATILNARANDSDLASAITAAQGVLDGANNTVAYQATIDAAVTTLRSAITTAAAKITLLSGENITFMVENADFESSTPVIGGITTYDYDAANNGTSFSRMQVVEGWTIGENGNAKSSGVFEFGTTPFLGSSGASYQAPASASATGETKALGIVAVWNSTAQYKQNVTLPSGRYEIEIPIYNTAGTTDFAKNLIGFVENGGTEHLATVKTYATGRWITEKLRFDLNSETSGYLSLGYKAANSGSAAMPHLFIDKVTITYTSAENAYAQTRAEALEIYNSSEYANVVGTEKAALYNIMNPATAPSTVEEYFAAVDNINAAVATFTAAKANYDALVAEIAHAKTLGIDAETADGYAANSESTAATVLASTQSLKVAEYTLITTTYTENSALGAWTEDFAEDRNGEGYVADGETYWNEWGSNTRTANQTVTLPAGDYAISAIGRGNIGTSGYLYYKLGDADPVTVDFLMKGNRGRGVDTSGAANFAEDGTYNCNGEGFGWEYRFLTFSLAEETTVELGVSATFANNWVSIYAPKLFTTEATVKSVTLNFINNELTNNIPDGKMNSDVLSALNTKKAAAQDASMSNTKEELNTILEELRTAIDAAQASVNDYAAGKQAIDKADDILSKTNVYTPEAYTTFAEALEAARTNYDNGTWTGTEGALYKNGMLGTGWHTSATVSTLLSSAWDNAKGNWNDYHVNTWSTIDDSGNPNLVVPTFEYWVSETSKLADKVMTATLTLEPYETYTVAAHITAARNTTDYNAEGADQTLAPVGVTLQVGGGTPITCTGTRVAETRFFEGTFEATGEADGEGKLTIKIAANETDANWILFRDVKYTKQPAAEATADEKAALATAITEAEAHIIGFDKDEYAPYNNIDALTKLAVAKNAYANSTTKPAINGSKDALKTAVWTVNEEEVNAVFDGTLANAPIQATSENVVLPGWVTKSGNTRQTFKGTDENGKACLADADAQVGLFVHPGVYNYGETDGYTMPLKAGVIYKAEAKYCSWANASNNNFSLSILKNGKTVKTRDYGKHSTACTEEGALKKVELLFEVEADGNYVLSVTANGNTFMTDFYIKRAVAEEITIAETADYTPAEKYANVTFNRTLVEGWNGLVLPFDMTVTGIKNKFSATKVKNFTGITYDEAKGVTLNFDNFDSETTVIPAGTPFLVKTNSAGTSYTINGVVLPANGLQNITKTADGNDNIQYTMKGTHAASTNLTNVSFALIQGNTFFYHDGAAAKASSAKAFRAYFENESSEPNAARVSFDFGDGETTGITELAQPKTAADGTYYDLQGRKVETFKQKGIYIVNGRKVVK